MRPIRPPQLVIGVAALSLLIASSIGLLRSGGDPKGEAVTVAAGAVTMIDLKFTPAKVTAGVGDTVTWTNEDSATHTVTSDGEGPLDSGDVGGDGTFDFAFDTAGTFRYVCTIHPSMEGVVEVKA